MRALKIATIVMGILILAGTAVVIVTIVRRAASGPMAGPVGGPSGAPGMVARVGEPAGTARRTFAATLDEPAGTAIEEIARVGDRLALRLRGGGTDRVLLIDPASGAVVGRITLAR